MLRDRFLPQNFTDKDDVHVAGTAASGAMGPVIRCLVWNIYKAKRSRWLEDFTDLVADRDLVLLQEAVVNAPTDSFFSQSSRFEWLMARSFKDPQSRIEHGVKTGATRSSVSHRFCLSPHSEPVLNTQKLLLSTMYDLAGCSEHLLVLNMHAINFVNTRKYVEHLDQLVAALTEHTGPVILGGDFNTWNPRRLDYFQRVARGADLEEAVMQRRSRLAHMNRHLDHLFYRGLKLRSADSLGHYRSSDHAPITATFEYC